MPLTIGLLLGLSFVVSVLALAFLIWAVATRQITMQKGDAATVFGAEGAGHPDVDGTHLFDTTGIDRISARPVLVLIAAAIFWLVVGSLFGVGASLKLHWPDWLTGSAPLTFGRMRTLHLNLVIYGWLSQVGIAGMMWILPRIFRTPLKMPGLPLAGAVIWNLTVAAGGWAIATGWTDGEEWLEIPWQLDILLALAGVFFVLPMIQTARKREVHHIYVTGWYFLGAMIWFPFLFIVANLPGIHYGVEEATTNWWFAHNVLGLWLTPLGVGTAYYFIPKIIGKPVYSYAVSLLGFWGLALFYSQVGIHHLIGGPVPTWVVTLSVVHSVMMFIPVIAVAVNQHVTVARNTWALKQSLPLRFIAFGALMYTFASFQGSIEALRSVNTITHFTHYTIGHAHLGAYAFVSIVMFGSVYHIMPRLLGREFAWPGLIRAHFWLVVLGFAIYFFALSIGGVLQGLAMLDATRPFAESVILMKPYLEARSIGGSMMTLGHILFALNFIGILLARPGTAAKPVVAE
ncbi:cbb3-type cytochrome c oxidase subunit I [Pseudodonghicola flavimaris]|uniref:Cbb3-type cytochrome c oxidase subunit I n=1 Tax=Pseudodonghicola flavimaris TaxID=3050036 RepID=A0ABT7F345_9RHOB|nr:cbb3-type cytochrome c oxidase subunit I [Pseudodonghicola flavimaris]MDK3018905.1 cbb3-type cytochrome c oxidase subunit I [Pseudodonghicola flavimaris]